MLYLAFMPLERVTLVVYVGISCPHLVCTAMLDWWCRVHRNFVFFCEPVPTGGAPPNPHLKEQYK